MSMRALVIQHDHLSPLGPIAEAFTGHGFALEELLVVPADRFHSPSVTVRFPEAAGYDAIVPMGAPWSVYDHGRIGSWVQDEIGFLRAAHEAGVPIFGVCFGGQALAAALGGEVVPAERPEIGWTTVETDRPDLVPPGPWFQWHGDRWVLPPHLSAFARTVVADQAFVVGRSLGLQFHPESTPAMLDGWLSNGGAAHARALGLDPDALRAEMAQRAAEAARRAADLVTAFLERVAGAASPPGAPRVEARLT
jgi:GMP synthase-like glutamine amidotransferase